MENGRGTIYCSTSLLRTFKFSIFFNIVLIDSGIYNIYFTQYTFLLKCLFFFFLFLVIQMCFYAFMWIIHVFLDKPWIIENYLVKHTDDLSLIIIYDSIRNFCSFLHAKWMRDFLWICIALKFDIEPSSNHDFMHTYAVSLLLNEPSRGKQNRGCHEFTSFVHKRIGNYRGGSHKCHPSLDRFIIINYPSRERKAWPALWEPECEWMTWAVRDTRVYNFHHFFIFLRHQDVQNDQHGGTTFVEITRSD